MCLGELRLKTLSQTWCSRMLHRSHCGARLRVSIKWIFISALLCAVGRRVSPLQGAVNDTRPQYTVDFERYVCSNADPRQSADEAGDCTPEDVADVKYCALKQAAREQIRKCRKVEFNFGPPGGKKVLNCFVGLAFLVRSSHSLCTKLIKSGKHPPNCTGEALLSMAKQTVRRCGLLVPHNAQKPPVACTGGVLGTSTPQNSTGQMDRIILARLCVTILSRPSEFIFSHSNGSAPACWLPELVQTRQLYQSQGVWDVDDKCIDVVQTVFSRLVSTVYTRLEQFLVPRIYPVLLKRLGKSTADLLKYIAFSILRVGPLLVQRYKLPAYISRFRDTARQRRPSGHMQGTASTRATVSCKGLRGIPSAVRNTILALLQLLLVDIAQHRRFELKSTLVVAAFWDYLPCMLSSLV